jgi:endogenous inhibitor of DNA gyrase (YacG/DUF329 family)
MSIDYEYSDVCEYCGGETSLTGECYECGKQQPMQVWIDGKLHSKLSMADTLDMNAHRGRDGVCSDCGRYLTVWAEHAAGPFRCGRCWQRVALAIVICMREKHPMSLVPALVDALKAENIA